MEPDASSAEREARRWVESNIEALVPAMRKFAAAMKALELEQAKGHKAVSPERLDEELRLTEEMPICKFWGEWNMEKPLPLGFRIVDGSVLIGDKAFLDNDLQTKRADHNYLEATDGSGFIIDHCTGLLFKRRDESIPKGKRLAAVVERAGDLTSTFTTSTGISHTFLMGKKADIAARVGLAYDTQPRYES